MGVYFTNDSLLCRELSQNNLGDDRCEQKIGNLSKLSDLKLNQNKLTRFPVFVGLQLLDTLELSNNDIQMITAEALMAVPKLTFLDLSRNAIKTILPNSFPKGNLLQKM